MPSELEIFWIQIRTDNFSVFSGSKLLVFVNKSPAGKELTDAYLRALKQIIEFIHGRLIRSPTEKKQWTILKGPEVPILH